MLIFFNGLVFFQEFVTFLLDRGAFVDGETEDLLEEKMPELAGRDLSRNRTNRDTAENRLFHVLYEEADAPGRFLPAWSEAEANNNAKVYESDDYCLMLFHKKIAFEDITGR